MKLHSCFLGVLVLLTAFCVPAEEDLPPEAFLRQVGKAGAAQRSFAILSGEIQHYRRNSGTVETHPAAFAIRFAGGEMQAVLNLNNNQECYRMKRNALLRTHEVQPAAAGPLLRELGFEPEDLVMGFLDGNLVSESPRDTLKTVPCRVLQLTGKHQQSVKVWIAAEYFFPLKAEFYGVPVTYGETPQRVRTLEITGFKKIKERYVPTDMAVLAPEFRTRIAFKDCEVAEADDPRISEIFAENKQAESGKQNGSKR